MQPLFPRTQQRIDRVNCGQITASAFADTPVSGGFAFGSRFPKRIAM